MNPIYQKFFANRQLLSGKVFDSPASQLFRLENATSSLLPQLGAFSRPHFNRRGSGRGVRAEVLELAGGVGGAEFKPVDGKLGRKLCGQREVYLKKQLTRLHRLLQQFK